LYQAEFDLLPVHKIAYLTVRKSGCTSIKQRLAELRGENRRRDSQQIHENHAHLVMAKDFDRQPEWFSFTIVREPINRFLSFYCNKVLDQNLNDNPTIRNRGRYGYFPNMPLDDAIDTLCGCRFEPEPHGVPQATLIDQVGFELDYIGRLERLDESAGAIRNATGLELLDRHLNRFGGPKPLISASQFARLADFYAEDIRRFGYASDYSDWLEQSAQRKPGAFDLEPGFEFVNEAKLLNYSVKCVNQRYVIDLHWRLAREPRRARYLRVVLNTGTAQRYVLFHLRKNTQLTDQMDSQREVQERVVFKMERIPVEYRREPLFFELYFWWPEIKTADLVGAGRNNKLLIALPTSEDLELGVMPRRFRWIRD